MAKLSPLLREKLDVDPVPVRCVIEVSPGRLDYVLSQLDEMGIKVDKSLISQPVPGGSFYIPAVIPSDKLVEVSEIPGVVSVSKSLVRAVGFLLGLKKITDQFKVFEDELLGEVKISAVEIPRGAFIQNLPLSPHSLVRKIGSIPGILTGINPTSNVRVFPTGITAKILKDVGTYDGVGQTVAILDTGSPALTHQFISKTTSLEQYSVLPEPPEDFQGHGSWCHNCVCGPEGYSPYGKLMGMAPAVEKSIHVKVLSTAGSGATEGILKGIELAVKRGAKVISMSLGGPAEGGVEDDVECKVIDKLANNGIIFVIAAGNSGPETFTAGAPGCALKALTVGSVSIMDSFKPAWWSSRLQSEWYGNHPDEFEKDLDKYGDLLIKPDCTATGGGRAYKESKPDEVIWSGEFGWFEGFYDGIKDATGGMHGCIRADAVIPTFEEPKYLDDIEEGDVIPTFNGFGLSPAKVIKKWYTGIKPVYNIRTRNKELFATPNHPLLVFAKGKGLTWMTVEDITRLNDRSKVAVAITKKLPSKTMRRIGEGLARWLGYFLGDGWITEVNRSYTIHLADDNKGKVNYYLELGDELFCVRWKKHNGYWRFTSKKVGELITELGLNKPSTEKTIPDWVFTLPDNEKLAFIQGYIDADGHVVKRDGAIAFECRSKDLIVKLWILLQQLGYTSVSKPYSRKRKTKAPNSKEAKIRETYCLYVRNGMKYTRPDPVRHGEIEKLVDTGYIGFQSIKGIEYVGEDDVYDLTVDSTHNFIANSLFCHNTSQATPHVAGLVACLLSDGVIDTVEDVKNMLRDTANDYIIPDPHNEDEDMKYIEEHGKSIATGWGLFKLSRFRR
ncbi:MAG: hypothetical protein DRP92_01340 [Candidatus Neomarinimicrobiota bacterium]|nr:MAG: hypothetical protein DRP92_01340 [Candidatus Neomarinimicrobiota bacterium]